jgi:signal peptidase I
MIEAFSGYAEEFKQSLKRPRKFLVSVLNLGAVVFSALMLWKLLMVTSGSEYPVVVVMSGSMEPGFHRGDILFLSLTQEKFQAQDITVFQVEGKEIPIVHRTLNVHDAEISKKSLAVLTKGDNNNLDDRGLYNRGQNFLAHKNMMGRAKGIMPNAGIITIWLNDYPWFKIAVIVWMVFFALIGRD